MATRARATKGQKLDQQRILDLLCNLPPVELFYCCDEPDQQRQWRLVHQTYLSIHEKLKAYFEGRPDPIEGNPIADEWYTLQRDIWIRFYTVIQFTWERGLSVRLAARLKEKGQPPIKAPGDAILAALEQQSALMMHQAFVPYQRWTPYQARKDRRLIAQGNQLEAKDGPLALPEQSAIKKYKSIIHTMEREVLRLEWLLPICIDICYGLSKEPRHRRTKVYLSEFLNVLEQNKQFQSRLFSERSGTIGHEWKSGKRLPVKGSGV